MFGISVLSRRGELRACCRQAMPPWFLHMQGNAKTTHAWLKSIPSQRPLSHGTTAPTSITGPRARSRAVNALPDLRTDIGLAIASTGSAFGSHRIARYIWLRPIPTASGCDLTPRRSARSKTRVAGSSHWSAVRAPTIAGVLFSYWRQLNSRRFVLVVRHKPPFVRDPSRPSRPSHSN